MMDTTPAAPPEATGKVIAPTAKERIEFAETMLFAEAMLAVDELFRKRLEIEVELRCRLGDLLDRLRRIDPELRAQPVPTIPRGDDRILRVMNRRRALIQKDGPEEEKR
jgi:hypothetical protein